MVATLALGFQGADHGTTCSQNSEVGSNLRFAFTAGQRELDLPQGQWGRFGRQEAGCQAGSQLTVAVCTLCLAESKTPNSQGSENPPSFFLAWFPLCRRARSAVSQACSPLTVCPR